MPNLAWFLVSYGICFGLQNDKAKFISDFLRKISFFDKMLACTYCTGFHCGWITWLIALLTGDVSLSPAVIAWAFSSSAFCYIADSAVRWLEIHSAPPQP